MHVEFEPYHRSEILHGHLHLGGSNPGGERIEVNSLCLTRGGQPWLPVMGEFHFSRCDPAQWQTELCKMKAGGVTMVSTYLFWIHHEEREGEPAVLRPAGRAPVRAVLPQGRAGCGAAHRPLGPRRMPQRRIPRLAAAQGHPAAAEPPGLSGAGPGMVPQHLPAGPRPALPRRRADCRHPAGKRAGGQQRPSRGAQTDRGGGRVRGAALHCHGLERGQRGAHPDGGGAAGLCGLSRRPWTQHRDPLPLSPQYPVQPHPQRHGGGRRPAAHRRAGRLAAAL